MEKVKIVQEAFEKAKELYPSKKGALCLSVELWRFSTGNEKTSTMLYVDAKLVFESESFQKLLDFLGITHAGNIEDEVQSYQGVGETF